MPSSSLLLPLLLPLLFPSSAPPGHHEPDSLQQQGSAAAVHLYLTKGCVSCFGKRGVELKQKMGRRRCQVPRLSMTPQVWRRLPRGEPVTHSARASMYVVRTLPTICPCTGTRHAAFCCYCCVLVYWVVLRCTTRGARTSKTEPIHLPP